MPEELPDDHAIVCIHCGYDIRIRGQLQTKRTLDTSVNDRLGWLMPGVISLVVSVFFCGIVAFLWLGLGPLIENFYKDSWFSFIDSRMFKVWGSVFCGFVIFFTAQFAFLRLIKHSDPPEIELE